MLAFQDAADDPPLDRKAGHTFSQPDLIISATALSHGLTNLSRDTSDYERAHVPVVDPWRWVSAEAGIEMRS